MKRILFALVGALALILSACGPDAESESFGPTDVNAPPTTSATPTPCPPADGSGERKIDFDASFENCLTAGKKYTATFDTTEGSVVVDLDTEKTPQTANNFVALARSHYYDGTTIFRTDNTIDIIQGGAPHSENPADEGPGYTIKDEGGKFSYSEGDLVMARTGAPNSASAQFFFVTGPKAALLDDQGTYVVFGKASAGVDVLKKIIGLNQETDSNLGGEPSRTVTINKLTISES